MDKIEKLIAYHTKDAAEGLARSLRERASTPPVIPEEEERDA